MISEYKEETEAIVEALHKSVRKLEEYNTSGYETKEGKGGTDIVTQADKDLQEHLINFFQEEFPESGIIAEEDHGVEEKDRNFIIDPIDGTINYAAGRNYFCISIAYQEDGEVVAGGIASPEFENGVISIGVKGKGAWCETDYKFEGTQEMGFEEALGEITESERIQADSGRENLDESLGMVEASSVPDIEDKMSELRIDIGATYVQPGSSALELVEIARGNIDFRIDTIDIWDFAAGHLIVEEAGSKTFTTDYHSDSLGRDLHFAVAAGEGHMDELEDIIRNSEFMEEKE